jgi:hypothetical protein
MTDLRKAAELALDALEILSKNELPKKGAAKAELDEVVIPTLRQALAHEEKPLVKSYCGGKPNYCTPEVTPAVIGEAEIERLKKEVEHWKQAYHRVKTENEKLSLDLGIKNKDFI